MTSRSIGGLFQTLAFGVFIGALVSPAMSQNYMYSQTGLRTGANPTWVAVADFNRDGRLDLATANQGDNTVSIILTKTDGTFATKVDYPVGKTPVQLVTADFNGDEIIDLAVVNSADNTVSLLFGVGDGTFKPQATIPTGNNPTAIAAGDFDGDGNVDLAVANQSDSTISILLGNGKGVFTSQTPISLNGAPHSLISGDANNDGKADLFAVGTTNSGDVAFLLTSTGSGTFSVTTNGFPVGGSGSVIANIALGDFSNDGNLDVAYSITPQLVNDDFDVWVLMGDGTGSFTATSAVSLNVSSTGSFNPPPASVAVADFNHDGKLDLVVVEASSVAIYPGIGDGTFKSPLLGSVLTGGFTNGPQQLVVAADFNNDALPDLAVIAPASNVAAILLGNGDGTLGSRYDIPLPASGTTAAALVADFNHDGNPDVAIAQFSQAFPSGIISGFVTSLLGNGDGTLQLPFSTPSGDIGIGQLVTGDFTGNGSDDLASADVNANGGIAVFLGDFKGSFVSPPIESFITGSANPLNPGPMVVGDFNRDGMSDLVVVSENSGNSSPLYILLSHGNGTFQANFVYNLAYGFVPDLAVADFNHDGFLDVAATTQNEVLVFLGRGDGTFQAPVPYTNTALFTNSVATGDFNGDGKPDMVVDTSGALLFYAGNGDGTFQAPVSSPTLSSQSSLLAADYNGDGVLDVAGNTLDFVYIGNGDGTFQGGVPFQATYGVSTLFDGAIGELNRDGTVDLVQVSQAPNPQLGTTVPQTATVWLSTPTLSLTASSLQFGPQSIGTSSPIESVQLSNVGNSLLDLTSIATSGDFSQTNSCSTTLKVKDGCSIQVTFTPTANGPRSGTLTFSHNGKPSMQSLPLSGWAGPPDFVPSVSPASVTVKAGNSAKYFLVVASGDGFAGTVQVTCSGTPSKATCALSSQSVSVGANGTARVQVTVSTTAPSSAEFLPLSMMTNRQLAGFPVFCIVLVCCGGLLISTRRTFRIVPGLGLCLLLAACDSGSLSTGPPPPVSGTPAGSYTLALIMTSGNSNHSLTTTLVVQ